MHCKSELVKLVLKRPWLSIEHLYRDDGKENGNYYIILELYVDNGEENGDYYIRSKVLGCEDLGLSGLGWIGTQSFGLHVALRAYKRPPLHEIYATRFRGLGFRV